MLFILKKCRARFFLFDHCLTQKKIFSEKTFFVPVKKRDTGEKHFA